jgi:hypothetical protein
MLFKTAEIIYKEKEFLQQVFFCLFIRFSCTSLKKFMHFFINKKFKNSTISCIWLQE